MTSQSTSDVKKAVLVGINYEGTSNQLYGCINDVTNVRNMLLTKGYQECNITVMTDHTIIKPTRANILSSLLNMILSGSKNMFFHYSGHGSYVKDVDGDEEDGRDETLVPIDFLENGMIIDDEIRGILKSLGEEQSLFCIFDCCHSGTGMDLKYNVYDRMGKSYLLVDNRKEYPTRGGCVCLSGCQDNQTSADAFEAGQSQGAMSYGFLEALKDPKVKSYEELLIKIRGLLKQKRYTQLPAMSSGKIINLKSAFSF